VDCLDEDTVLALVDGRLDAVARTAVERHLADCSECSELVAAATGADIVASQAALLPPAGEAAALARGVTVGRYVILDIVGRGGMGEVYAAYDPQLDRKIALKLLHPTLAHRGSQDARDRLLREAKAIARLSHANVVVVHDAGTIDDRVFVAMEFVEGETLAAWLGAAPRGWRAVRDAFAAAGDGLAAAHEAGLVHRDFKPHNVMVAREGAVRVMDFGLASDTSADSGGAAAALALPENEPPTSDTIALTATGKLLGTPLYMAPEQFLSRPTDARTDQFSFCVALHEALYGERPFASDSLLGLADAVTTGKLREPAHKGRAPAFLRRLLLRGLRPDPADRYPSMRELLDDLRFDPARRRRIATAVAAGAALLAVAAVGAERLATRGKRVCMAEADKLVEIWEVAESGPRRDAIRRAFIATGAGFAGEMWTRVSGLLDDYARRWSRVYAHACEATHDRRGQSADVLAARMTCLEERRDALRALTDVFTHADTTVVVQAVNAARELPSLDRCDDGVGLPGKSAAPDPATRARVASLRAALAEVKALSDTGQFTVALRKVGPMVEAARATGQGALLAEVLERRSWLEERLGDERAAVATFQEALWEAIAAQRDDIALMCAAQLVGTSGYHLNDHWSAERWARLGHALLKRLGPGHERAAGWLMHNQGITVQRRGDIKTALAHMRAGLELKQQVLPANHADIAVSLGGIGNVLAELGDYAGALAAQDKFLDIFTENYGADSPLLAVGFGNRGEVLELLGRHKEAERDLRASVDRWAAQLGPDHPWRAYPLTALGKTLLSDGRPREAIAPLEKAVDIRERAEPNRELAAESRFALARARWEAGGSRAEARALAVAARDSYRKLPTHTKRAAEIDAWLADRGGK
jgi:eukaryotic-like serine/threonine-protein kinase